MAPIHCPQFSYSFKNIQLNQMYLKTIQKTDGFRSGAKEKQSSLEPD